MPGAWIRQPQQRTSLREGTESVRVKAYSTQLAEFAPDS
jgi:hypothetical protein